jgi:hypothetical protein
VQDDGHDHLRRTEPLSNLAVVITFKVAKDESLSPTATKMHDGLLNHTAHFPSGVSGFGTEGWIFNQVILDFF